MDKTTAKAATKNAADQQQLRQRQRLLHGINISAKTVSVCVCACASAVCVCVPALCVLCCDPIFEYSLQGRAQISSVIWTVWYLYSPC